MEMPIGSLVNWEERLSTHFPQNCPLLSALLGLIARADPGQHAEACAQPTSTA